MARYRKVDPRIWNDAKFHGLSLHGKLAFLYLLTHPHMTMLGAMRATAEGLALELGDVKAFGEAFGELFRKGLAKVDLEAHFISLPNFLKYNPPENPNVVKSWASADDLIPECPLKTLLLQEAKAFLEGYGKGFAEAFPKGLAKGMAKGMAKQEQEQEQEQCLVASQLSSDIPTDLFPKDQKPKSVKSERTSALRKFPIPDDFALTPELEEYAVGILGAKLDAVGLFQHFRDHHLKKNDRFSDWSAAWRTWVSNAQRFGFPTKVVDPDSEIKEMAEVARRRFMVDLPAAIAAIPDHGDVSGLNLSDGEAF